MFDISTRTEWLTKGRTVLVVKDKEKGGDVCSVVNCNNVVNFNTCRKL